MTSLWTAHWWNLPSIIEEEQARIQPLPEPERSVELASLYWSARGKHAVARFYVWEWFIPLLPFWHQWKMKKFQQLAEVRAERASLQFDLLSCGAHDVVGTILLAKVPHKAEPHLHEAVGLATKHERPLHERALPLARLALSGAHNREKFEASKRHYEEYAKRVDRLLILSTNEGSAHHAQISRVCALLGEFHLCTGNLPSARRCTAEGIRLAWNAGAVSQMTHNLILYLRTRLLGH